MLVFAPGLPRLQLELGVLYYRLAAFETARSYFEPAVSGPNVPEEVESKVNEYLAQIDEAGKTTRFFGQVRAGIATRPMQIGSQRTAPSFSTGCLSSGSRRGGPDGNVYGSGFRDLPSRGIFEETWSYTVPSIQFDELDTTVAELTRPRI